MGDLGGGTTRADTAIAAAAGITVTEDVESGRALFDAFFVGDLANLLSSLVESSRLSFLYNKMQ